MTPPGKRVQTINPPGSEVGPGADGAVATGRTAVADEVDAMGFIWERKGRSSSTYHLTGVVLNYSFKKRSCRDYF